MEESKRDALMGEFIALIEASAPNERFIAVTEELMPEMKIPECDIMLAARELCARSNFGIKDAAVTMQLTKDTLQAEDDPVLRIINRYAVISLTVSTFAQLFRTKGSIHSDVSWHEITIRFVGK